MGLKVSNLVFFKSLHQVDSLAALASSSKPLHPPYLDSNTLAQSSPWFCKRCHFHLPSKAMLKVLMSLIPSPPLSFGRHSFSHLIHEIFFWSGPPPHRNVRYIFTSLSTTD
ncbi:hypothetical protein GYH30_004230 [Glycine max]|uniref:Uncharacterized protein n=1 Tax=Glycine max TaxID=3847 RepID=A0A0R0KY76_SOYBN|nr:hypothetical protein JHK86_004362 [Glycine max]KAH1060670.1 hypothetical protein GYH30_004230 [Glycine max]